MTIVSLYYQAGHCSITMRCHVGTLQHYHCATIFGVGNPVNPVQAPGGENGDTIPTTYTWSRPSLEYSGSAICESARCPNVFYPQLFLDDKNFLRVFELMEGNGSSRRRRTRGFPIIIHLLKAYQRCPVGTRSGSQCCGKTPVIIIRGYNFRRPPCGQTEVKPPSSRTQRQTGPGHCVSLRYQYAVYAMCQYQEKPLCCCFFFSFWV